MNNAYVLSKNEEENDQGVGVCMVKLVLVVVEMQQLSVKGGIKDAEANIGFASEGKTWLIVMDYEQRFTLDGCLMQIYGRKRGYYLGDVKMMMLKSG